jgi:nicotinic acid mononucleotide adenylyltransferase
VAPQAVSATTIRERLARGNGADDALRGLLPAAVLAYIDRNQLYRPRPDAT